MTFDEWWEENFLRIYNQADLKYKTMCREAFEAAPTAETDHYHSEAVRLNKVLQGLCDSKGRQFNSYIEPIKVV